MRRCRVIGRNGCPRTKRVLGQSGFEFLGAIEQTNARKRERILEKQKQDNI